MLIKRIRIANFRSILSAEIELGETTVLIGPNNAGKTAILEAIRIALTRRWGQKGTGFTEYDVHLCAARPDPKVGDPVVIEVELQEDSVGDWPQELQDELADIIQLEPNTGLASIILRVSCSWDASEESYIPRWEFLNVDHNPLVGKGARSVNMQEFFQYLPVFYLEALRDAGDEFSVRSQFWGKLLRTVQIPDELELKSKKIFDLLNRKLLAADPLLGRLATNLSQVGNVARTNAPGVADLRVLPLNTWDLISKAEVVYQAEAGRPWLPLPRHGQGVQSLSVMFLFKAFIELALTDLYRPESTAVLALEEPETHLHPQAARSLSAQVAALSGQKIITTHSPYFLQNVAFRDIRVVRLTADGTAVMSMPKEFRAVMPTLPALNTIIGRSGGKILYDQGLGEIVVKGRLDESEYRELLVAYHGRLDTPDLHSRLRSLLDGSKKFIADEELDQLETFARRIRGEIFFAHKWFLVEGQSEYNLVHGIASGLNYNLDEHGVSVIDFQNNGNAQCFAALARALGYPWIMLVDGDAAGSSYMTAVENRGFDAPEVARRSFQLPNRCLEVQLVADGLQNELKAILSSLNVANANSLSDPDLISALEANKSAYSAILARQCAQSPALTQRMPAKIRDAVASLRGLV